MVSQARRRRLAEETETERERLAASQYHQLVAAPVQAVAAAAVPEPAAIVRRRSSPLNTRTSTIPRSKRSHTHVQDSPWTTYWHLFVQGDEKDDGLFLGSAESVMSKVILATISRDR